MDKSNLNFNFNQIIVYLLSIMSWFSVSICWKLDNSNILYANQEVLYNCPLNSMCRCFPNETSLMEINCNEVTLYKFPEFLLGTLKHLEISHTQIQNVDEETFQGLRLESLKLVSNKLLEFSEKSFSFMSHSLVSMDISGNLFQSIPLESIRSIHTLSRLIAQRNFIQHLDGNWGNLADSLRTLHLSENSITEITFSHDEKKHNYSTSALSSLPTLIQMHHPSSGLLTEQEKKQQQQQQQQHHQQQQMGGSKQQSYRTFSKLKKLVWLDLSSNRIQHIGLNTLPKTLLTLDISKNLFSVFPTLVLDHLRDLRILSMRDNLLTILNDITFQSFKTHLEKVDLSQNNIDELPQHLFNQTTRIKAINFDKNFITLIPSYAFTNLSIVHMVLSYNHINHIEAKAFESLENTLEYLDLERNSLTTFPSAIYNLNRLHFLYLTSNAISTVDLLPATLKVLSLSSNNFSSIPVDVLGNCTGLSYLNMGYNKIMNIEPNTFAGWGTELQTLLLRNNKISDLLYGAFNGLDSIKEISLSFNDIHNIHPMVFENVSKSLKILELSFSIYSEDYPQEAISYLTELMWLGLDNNNLKIIPDDSLSNLSELTYINLSFNRLTLIPTELFKSDVHRNMLEIDMSYNAIEKLTTGTFHDLAMLQIINLSSNKIKSIQRLTFDNLPHLTFIDLTYNQLKNLSDNAFESLPNLLSVDLMFNTLATFSLKCFKHVSNTSKPMSINVSNNAINHFDGELNTYLYIYSLDVSNNLIAEPQSFKNIGYSLRILYLNGNNLSSLGNHAFGDLPFLEILNLARNNISSLRRRSFQGLANLQELDLGHNQLDLLQVEQFSNLNKLRYLKLNNNQLRGLPRDAFLNTRIEYLDLSNNFISIWPVNPFSDIGFTLRCVRFEHNQVEYLDSTMYVNTQFLTELSLSHNHLKVLPDSTFSTLNNLTTLDLSFNPLITTNFKELLLNIPQLRFLNLRSTGLYTVPIMFLNYLMELDLSQNQIQEVDSLLDLKYLRKLSISDNKIFNLTTLARNLPPSLRSLDVSRNPIRKISIHDFTPVRRIEELKIENIKITNTDAFIKLHSLKTLHISSQHNFSEIISKLRGLRELYVTVSDHEIDSKYFGKTLTNTKLNLIDITGHKLRSIAPNAFHGLTRNVNLKIQIRKTMISDLPRKLFYPLKQIPKLSIDLIDNKLTRFTPEIFYPNASAWDNSGTRSIMGGISTSGNWLPCDCEHVWFGHWLRRWLRETAQMNVVSKEEMKRMVKRARQSTCIDPATGKRISFLEIFPEDLLCHASALSSMGMSLKMKFLNIIALFVTSVFLLQL